MNGATRNRRRFRSAAGLAAPALVAAFLAAAPVVSAGEEKEGFLKTDALSPLPPAPKLDAAKVSLGRQLFHDPILSRENTLACNSCHDLGNGGTVHLKRTPGYDGAGDTYNAPTIFNVGSNHRFGWRGTTRSLTEQTANVLVSPSLMGNQWDILLSRINANRRYLAEFNAVYGRAADEQSVLDALVTFQRSLVTPDAPLDRYLRGDFAAISIQQKLGYRLFNDYGCVSCHQGANIGGNMFQIFGVFGDPDSEASLVASHVEARLDQHESHPDLFRVPSLRNVAVTAPYFHDGRAETLHEAISIMAKSQLGRSLPDNDIAAIQSFLESLTGTYDGKSLSSSAEDRE